MPRIGQTCELWFVQRSETLAPEISATHSQHQISSNQDFCLCEALLPWGSQRSDCHRDVSIEAHFNVCMKSYHANKGIWKPKLKSPEWKANDSSDHPCGHCLNEALCTKPSLCLLDTSLHSFWMYSQPRLIKGGSSNSKTSHGFFISSEQSRQKSANHSSVLLEAPGISSVVLNWGYLSSFPMGWWTNSIVENQPLGYFWMLRSLGLLSNTNILNLHPTPDVLD